MSVTFTELGVPARLADALAAIGMTEAFDVQAAAIPDALAGRDVCGRAPTGSGKTIAFGVPLLARVEKASPQKPTALILSPTRELADQIRTELLPVARAAGRQVAAVYGGVGYGDQTRALRRGVDVLVACPGRLLDLIDHGDVSLAHVGIVVVDEADRMADMGFLPSVKKLLDMTRADRQTLLFSATLDGDIAELTRRYQNDPVRHEVGDAEPDVHAMTHHFWQIRHEDRVDHARDAIVAAGPTIVFTRTRHGADRLAKQLDRAGVQTAAIHGGRSQNQRTRALDDFASGRVRALIATDVAARGIHVDGVECVVHFDPPEDDKTYLHRSGRTARAGARGVVVTFVRPNSHKDVKTLQRDLGLPQGFDQPDPAQLGDGSLHAAAKQRPQAASKPASSRSDGQRPRRERPERSAKPGGQRPQKRNANLYEPGDPRLERRTEGRRGGHAKPSSPTGPKAGPKGAKAHRKGGGAKKRSR
jgi:superfamily II DNA/RNA helicase